MSVAYETWSADFRRLWGDVAFEEDLGDGAERRGADRRDDGNVDRRDTSEATDEQGGSTEARPAETEGEGQASSSGQAPLVVSGEDHSTEQPFDSQGLLAVDPDSQNVGSDSNACLAEEQASQNVGSDSNACLAGGELPCPECGRGVWYEDDDTLTWCDACPWMGFGDDLKGGRQSIVFGNTGDPAHEPGGA